MVCLWVESLSLPLLLGLVWAGGHSLASGGWGDHGSTCRWSMGTEGEEVAGLAAFPVLCLISGLVSSQLGHGFHFVGIDAC